MNNKFLKPIKYLVFVFLGLVLSSGARGVVELRNPLAISDEGGAAAFNQIAGIVISNFLQIIGSIALLMIIIGGFIWLTSAGNPEKVKKGRDVIVWTIVGLVIIFSAYTIISFVFEALPLEPQEISADEQAFSECLGGADPDAPEEGLGEYCKNKYLQ